MRIEQSLRIGWREIVERVQTRHRRARQRAGVERRDGRADLTGFEQGDAQVVLRHRVTRLQAQRLACRTHRLVGLAQRLVAGAQIELQRVVVQSESPRGAIRDPRRGAVDTRLGADSGQ